MEMNSAMVAMDSGAAASRARVAMDGMLALRFILSAAVGKMVSVLRGHFSAVSFKELLEWFVGRDKASV